MRLTVDCAVPVTTKHVWRAVNLATYGPVRVLCLQTPDHSGPPKHQRATSKWYRRANRQSDHHRRRHHRAFAPRRNGRGSETRHSVCVHDLIRARACRSLGTCGCRHGQGLAQHVVISVSRQRLSVISATLFCPPRVSTTSLACTPSPAKSVNGSRAFLMDSARASDEHGGVVMMRRMPRTWGRPLAATTTVEETGAGEVAATGATATTTATAIGMNGKVTVAIVAARVVATTVTPTMVCATAISGGTARALPQSANSRTHPARRAPTPARAGCGGVG